MANVTLRTRSMYSKSQIGTRFFEMTKAGKYYKLPFKSYAGGSVYMVHPIEVYSITSNIVLSRATLDHFLAIGVWGRCREEVEHNTWTSCT